MDNKRVVLINSYCNKQIKIDVLEKNINKIKSIGLDIILMSPIELPHNIIDLCDLYIQTKENPVTKWPDKTMFEFWSFIIDNTNYQLHLGKPDYGWASLYQIKKLSQIGLTYDYEYYFHIIYDTILDEKLLNEFSTNEKCLLFPSSKGFDVGGFFMGFNKETLRLFESLVTKDLYYKNHDVAETLLTNISKVLPCKISDYKTDDEIYYYNSLDLFNYSEFHEFKFFIHKRTLSDDSVKIFFYDMKETFDILLEVNDRTIRTKITNHQILDLSTHHDNIYNLSISYNNVKQNLITEYNNISHNKVTITPTDSNSTL